MRTTLALDDDVLAAAKHLAEREQTTLGAAVSALARQGIARGPHPAVRAQWNTAAAQPQERAAGDAGTGEPASRRTAVTRFLLDVNV